MVGRVALIGALLVGAVAVFLMTGGSGEGQERCPANGPADYCIEYPERGEWGGADRIDGGGPGGKGRDVEPERAETTRRDDFAESKEGKADFRSATPDFEAPGWTPDTDNVYEVTIQAEDG